MDRYDEKGCDFYLKKLIMLLAIIMFYTFFDAGITFADNKSPSQNTTSTDEEIEGIDKETSEERAESSHKEDDAASTTHQRKTEDSSKENHDATKSKAEKEQEADENTAEDKHTQHKNPHEPTTKRRTLTSTVSVTNAKEFHEALQHRDVHKIQLKADFSVGKSDEKLPRINRSLEIDGGGHTLQYLGSHIQKVTSNEDFTLKNIKIDSKVKQEATFKADDALSIHLENVTFTGDYFLKGESAHVYISGNNDIRTEYENIRAEQITFKSTATYKGENKSEYMFKLEGSTLFELKDRASIQLHTTNGGAIRLEDSGTLKLSDDAQLSIKQTVQDGGHFIKDVIRLPKSGKLELNPHATLKVSGHSTPIHGEKKSELVVHQDAIIEVVSTGKGELESPVVQFGTIQMSRGSSLTVKGGGTKTRTILNFEHESHEARFQVEEGAKVDLQNTSTSTPTSNVLMSMPNKGSFQFGNHAVQAWKKGSNIMERPSYSWSVVENIEGQLNGKKVVDVSINNTPTEYVHDADFKDVFLPKDFNRLTFSSDEWPVLQKPKPGSVTDVDEHLTGKGQAGLTVIVEDAAGNEIGRATVSKDGSYSISLTKPLPANQKIYTYVTDQSGNQSEKVLTVVKGVRLELQKIPNRIVFEQTKIQPKTLTIHRQDPEMSIEILDTRDDDNKWHLQAKVDQPLTSTSNKNHTLPDALVFVDQDVETVLTDSFATIYSNDTKAANTTKLTWTHDSGLLIKTNLSRAYAETYSTSIEWSLVDAP